MKKNKLLSKRTKLQFSMLKIIKLKTQQNYIADPEILISLTTFGKR